MHLPVATESSVSFGQVPPELEAKSRFYKINLGLATHTPASILGGSHPDDPKPLLQRCDAHIVDNALATVGRWCRLPVTDDSRDI
ncbi:MAG: hypothetical protein LQ352_005303 [Teloschistes flavicans]|nr:MAG: hypothetical protein LQ352_005303 [Teloschistes flavicans]